MSGSWVVNLVSWGVGRGFVGRFETLEAAEAFVQEHAREVRLTRGPGWTLAVDREVGE